MEYCVGQLGMTQESKNYYETFSRIIFKNETTTTLNVYNLASSTSATYICTLPFDYTSQQNFLISFNAKYLKLSVGSDTDVYDLDTCNKKTNFNFTSYELVTNYGRSVFVYNTGGGRYRLFNLNDYIFSDEFTYSESQNVRYNVYDTVYSGVILKYNSDSYGNLTIYKYANTTFTSVYMLNDVYDYSIESGRYVLLRMNDNTMSLLNLGTNFTRYSYGNHDPTSGSFVIGNSGKFVAYTTYKIVNGLYRYSVNVRKQDGNTLTCEIESFDFKIDDDANRVVTMLYNKTAYTIEISGCNNRRNLGKIDAWSSYRDTFIISNRNESNNIEHYDFQNDKFVTLCSNCSENPPYFVIISHRDRVLEVLDENGTYKLSIYDVSGITASRLASFSASGIQTFFGNYDLSIVFYKDSYKNWYSVTGIPTAGKIHFKKTIEGSSFFLTFYIHTNEKKTISIPNTLPSTQIHRKICYSFSFYYR